MLPGGLQYVVCVLDCRSSEFTTNTEYILRFFLSFPVVLIKQFRKLVNGQDLCILVASFSDE